MDKTPQISPNVDETSWICSQMFSIKGTSWESVFDTTAIHFGVGPGIQLLYSFCTPILIPWRKNHGFLGPKYEDLRKNTGCNQGYNGRHRHLWDPSCGVLISKVWLENVGIFPETNGSHLRMDGWKMSFLLGRLIFRGELLVSGSVSERKGW